MNDLSDDELAQILWDYNNLNQPLKKADAILVLGSNDIRVGRYGSELYLQDYAPLIIFSGNVGRITKELWNKPEAEVFKDEAIQMGVSKEKILVENKSSNTGENIKFTKKLLGEKQMDVKSIILVQKPYMLRRSYATCKKIWPEISLLVSSPHISFADYPNQFLSKELVINIMVGDTQRIKEYAKKGFQIPQEIPDKVWKAFEELVKRGYNKHLIEDL